jgi:hypothetical protein
MGAEVSLLVKVLNASWQAGVQSKVASLAKRLHKGLDMDEKFCINLL